MKLHDSLGYKLVGSCRKLNANQRSFFYYDVVYKVCFGQRSYWPLDQKQDLTAKIAKDRGREDKE